MGSDEFEEWKVLYAQEPWGTLIEDARTARILTMLANINRGPKQAPFKEQQFMPQYQKPQWRKRSADDLWQSLKFMTRMAGGDVIERQN